MLQHGGPDGQAGKRVVLYGRVSTPVQKVESQMAPLRAYAASRGLTVAEEITDVGISGKKASRPGLNRLMDMARKRLIDGVIVFQFSRFARSIRHLLEALQEFKSLGVSFISYSENVDTNTPLGEALFAVIGALSQLEADLIKERVLAGLARARAEGVILGRPKLGVSTEKIVEAYKQIRSVRLVAKQFKISPSTVQRMVAQWEAIEAEVLERGIQECGKASQKNDRDSL